MYFLLTRFGVIRKNEDICIYGTDALSDSRVMSQFIISSAKSHFLMVNCNMALFIAKICRRN